MARVFSNVDWVPWLALMLAYSCFYFVLFNALLGLLFWPRARRELLER